MRKFLMHRKPSDTAEMKNQIVVFKHIDTSINKANPQVRMNREHFG